MGIAAAQAQLREARSWLATLRYRQSLGIVDAAEVEGRLQAAVAAAEDAILAAELHRSNGGAPETEYDGARRLFRAPPVVARPVPVPVAAPIRPVMRPPPIRPAYAPPRKATGRCQRKGCGGYRGAHPHFCWNHRPPEDRVKGKWVQLPETVEPVVEEAPASLPAVPRDRLVRAKPCTLTDEECWSQAPSGQWQRGQRIGWHREVVLRPEQPPAVCVCGSRDLTYTGRTWWCNTCDTQVDPPDLGADEVIVYDVTVPGASFGVAASQEDADYLEATRLFRAGAVTHRPYGWIAPRWDRWKEGKPQRHR